MKTRRNVYKPNQNQNITRRQRHMITRNRPQSHLSRSQSSLSLQSTHSQPQRQSMSKNPVLITRSEQPTLPLVEQENSTLNPQTNTLPLQLQETVPSQSTTAEPSGSGNEDDLLKIYTKIKSIPSFSAKIADFLRKNDNYSQHRRIVRKTFPRRKIITQYPFQIFQADLIEYPRREFANRGYRFILLIIDSFSKMIYAEPVKRKNATCMSETFVKILNQFDFFPNSIITDQGLEFYNSSVQKVFALYGINHYHLKTKTAWKTPMAERAIRTIKSRLERYMRFRKTKCWVDVLPQVIKNYNRTPHRMIGMAPIKVTLQNSAQVYKKMFGDVNLRVIPKLSVGDNVRILKEKTFFEKGYTPNWSEEIYKISDVIQKAGVVWYKIKTLDNKTIPSIRYYYQLNLVSKHKDVLTR